MTGPLTNRVADDTLPGILVNSNFVKIVSPPTNGTEGVKLSADYGGYEIGINPTRNGAGRRMNVPDMGGLFWADGGAIWGWAAHGANGGELQFNGSPNIAIQEGSGSGGLPPVVQLGVSNPTHPRWYLQYDDNPVGGNVLGHSKPLAFAARAWDGSVARVGYPGFMGWTAGTDFATIGGVSRPLNTELRVYGHIPEWSTFGTHIPPDSITELYWRATFHTNGFTHIGKYLNTNSLIANSPVVTFSNGVSRFEGYMTVIKKDAAVTGGDLEVDTVNGLVLVGRQSSTGGDNTTTRFRDRTGGIYHQVGGLGNYFNTGGLVVGGNRAIASPYELEVGGDVGANTLTVTNSFKVGTGATIVNVLTNSATLDFPSTLAQTDSDLTITVTGAADGDPVELGAPNGSTLTGGCYTAWVSAANTVTVRFSVYGALAKDPASGVFKVTIFKH